MSAALSRRALLGTLSAVSASVAMPALSDQQLDNDKALIALGSQFSALAPVFYAAQRKSRRLLEVWRREVAKHGVIIRGFSEGAEQRLIDEVGLSTGYYPANDRFNELSEEMVRLSEAIRSHKPTTVVGLLVWGRAAEFEAADLSDPEAAYADSDCSTCQIFELVAHIERMVEASHG